MAIRLLPDDIASRIAAGEVVERPASVVKELVENSLDAGATRIEVETIDGGTKLIRVRDNGTGILSDEVALAFRRHSTSKLERATDLERIATLGFRGEALASIASVSRTTCITKHETETIGTRLRLEGGSVVSQSPTGRPHGTELVIEDLFYNVPARRKFLRTERTERRHIDSFMTRYAIAYPGTAFSLVHDGRKKLDTPGNKRAREVLLSVYGADLGASLLEISDELTGDHDIRVSGFVGPTTVHRANRGYLTLFINGRWIEDMRLSYAIIQAYHTLLPVKRYPVAFVMVQMPPQELDVNVHPAKAEVRFRDGDAIFRAIQRTVRTTVISDAPTTAGWSPRASEADTATAQQQSRARLAALQPSQSHIRFPKRENGQAPPGIGSADGAATSPPTPNGPTAATTSASRRDGDGELPPLRVIGQLATMFIIAEGPEGLYLIDQHAAHERVLYEQMRAKATQGQVASQPLLEPEVVALPADEATRLEETLPTLQELGLDVSAFGPNTYLVRAVPTQLKHLSPADLLADIAAATEDISPVRTELEEIVIRRICKRAAVKAGQVLSREEIDRLIQDLEATENPRTCPHGRPTIVQISTADLARQFGRGG